MVESGAGGRKSHGPAADSDKQPAPSAPDHRPARFRIRPRWRRSRPARDGDHLACFPVSAVRVPRRAATARSALSATFIVTNGRPRRMAVKNGTVEPLGLVAEDTNGHVDALLRCSISTPRPDTCGFGSSTAITARRIPASTTRGAQGPVRPTCEQGSSVQYNVAPCARAPASAKRVNLCVRPASDLVAPRPTTTPSSSTITAPTMGFGLVRPRPRSASDSARAMCARSTSLLSPSVTTFPRTAR